MKIELKGLAMFCQYASVERMHEEEEDFWSINYDLFYLVENIQIFADGEDITKQKGKYIVIPDLIHQEIFVADHPFPVEFRIVHDVDFSATIDLDVEDFDPKKLQLRKSVYELQEIPFAIDATHIVYDGKLYDLDFEDEWVDRWGYGESNTFIIEE